MMQITFAGEIGRRFGTSHKYAVKTPNEAIRVLCQLVPGFRTFLTSAHERGIFFQIVTSNQEEGITYDDLGLGCKSFTLVPVITGNLFGLFGGSGGGFLQILAGIALVAFAMTGFGVVTFGAIGTISAGVQTATMALGIGLLFNGVASLFAPGAPTGKNISEGRDADDAVSAGAAPVAVNGEAVPLLFGEYLVSRMPVIASYIQNNEGFFMGLVSEGMIAGYAEGGAEDNLYLDGLIAKSSLLTDVELTNGAQTSKIINNVQSAGFSIAVNAPFNAQGGEFGKPDDGVANTSVTRTFTQLEADTVRVRLSVGPCYQSKSKSTSEENIQNYRKYTEEDDSGGADNPTEINIRLFDGDGELIHERTERDEYLQQTSTKLHEYEFTVTDEKAPISIQVTRIDRQGPRGPVTVVGGSSQRQYSWVKGGVTWVSADVTWAERLVYPFSSLLALKFKAGEFSRFPQVQVRLKGIKVPTLNASLKVDYAFSQNPAYVLLGLLTDPRYGAGHRTYTIDGVEHIQAGIRMDDIDLASFYKAAQYCNDNKIQFNGYINKDADALELFRGIASTFQAQLIYAGGFITLVVDKEVDTDGDIRIYSSANTIASDEGGVAAPHFTYEGTALRARSTAVEVSYIEPAEFYKERKVLIEDPDLIDRYGYNLQTIRALGCTNVDQARRMGRYTLASNTLSTDTVSFKVGPDGAMLIPGDVCLILDPLKTRLISGGRIESSDNTSIITDRELSNRTYGSNYRLYIYGASGVSKKFAVSSVNSSGKQINITGQFGSNKPTTMDMWALVKENPERQLDKEPMYRVQSVKEEGDGTYSVIGIKYDKSKFAYVNESEGATLKTGGYGNRSYKSRQLTVKAKSINFSLRTPD
jgi:predicted phage tail protein